MSKELRQQLERLRHELESVYQLRRSERLAQLKLLEEITPGQGAASRLQSFTPSADVAALLGDIRAAVRRDVQRYAVGQPAEAEVLPPLPSSGPYTQHLRSQLAPLLNGVATGLNTAALPSGVAAYNQLLDEELASLTTAAALQGSLGPALVPKLKVIQQALQAQRYSDGLTLLKTLQRSDPHNHLVLFLLGQKPGALRNGAPFVDWSLPPALTRLRRRLGASDEGDRRFVRVLACVQDDGLEAVEGGCDRGPGGWRRQR